MRGTAFLLLAGVLLTAAVPMSGPGIAPALLGAGIEGQAPMGSGSGSAGPVGCGTNLQYTLNDGCHILVMRP